jgi:hypothetical protein
LGIHLQNGDLGRGNIGFQHKQTVLQPFELGARERASLHQRAASVDLPYHFGMGGLGGRDSLPRAVALRRQLGSTKLLQLAVKDADRLSRGHGLPLVDGQLHESAAVERSDFDDDIGKDLTGKRFVCL